MLEKHGNNRIILASASPRRRGLLAQIGICCEVLAVDVLEITDSMPPEKLVTHNCELKADEALRRTGGGAYIIAADTVVYANGKILGKPVDENDAFNMLKMLSGARHTVYTGVCVIAPNGDKKLFCESAEVFMRSLTDTLIRGYIAAGEPMDKAGAYGIQGIGSVFIEKITGDYFCVVGLPLCRLFAELEKLGFIPICNLSTTI